MVRPLLIFIGGLLITVIQCPAYGETYSWVDSSGTTNFTDNAGSIVLPQMEMDFQAA